MGGTAEREREERLSSLFSGRNEGKKRFEGQLSGFRKRKRQKRRTLTSSHLQSICPQA